LNGAEVQLFLDQRDAVREATRNDVAVYVVSSVGLTTDLGMASLMRTAGLRVLAEETGGDAIVNTNSYADGFARIVRDVGAYYLLGYVPAPAHRDGEVHDLDVRVNRPGVTVRARRSYYAPAAETGPVPEAVADGAPASLSTDTLEALRLPIAVSGLGMELFAAPFRGADGSGTVLLGAQVRGADLELGPGEPIEVAFRAMTTEGVRTPGKFTVFTLDLLEDSRTAVASDGLRVIDRITLPRGRHQLRFVVRQPNGRTGMVVADVEIPAFHDEPLSLSGVVLASQRLAMQHTLGEDAGLLLRLGAYPTAVRRFSRTDALTAYAEVYTRDDEREAEVTATLESVADGRRLALDVVAAVAGGGPGRMARVPLAGLEPGDYVLTFEARVDNRRATRQVPFSVLAD
jgi:hypothetical protein